METVTLSTKGQVALPKRVRDALRLKAGQQFTVTVEDQRIVLVPLEPELPLRHPLNPAGAKLSAAEVSRPVDLKNLKGDARRR